MKYTFVLLFTVFSTCAVLAQRTLSSQHSQPTTSNVQSTPPGCFADEFLRARLASDPVFAVRHELMNNAIRQYATGQQRAILFIPVVVHIIYDSFDDYLSFQQVQQGIADLNAAFSNSGAYYNSNGVNTNIQFCLAQTGPLGELTIGATWTQSPLAEMIVETQDDTLKNLIRWDPNSYLNIWLVKEITSASMGNGVAGYANFPSSQGQPEDGIVNEGRFFGTTADNSKIHIHEAGHYLGLYHTFEGGCANTNCQSDGDRVCDTPPDNSSAAVDCGQHVNSCDADDDDLSLNNPFRPVANGGLGDQPDMFRNYMDYGYQACQLYFSAGQSERMNAALTQSGRSILLQSTVCSSPCSLWLTSSITASSTSVFANESVVFTAEFQGTISSFAWKVNGVTTSSSSGFTYQFTEPGNYTVTLKTSNEDPACTHTETVTITVLCPAQANFQLLPEGEINPGDLVEANSQSIFATTFAWYLDGNLVSNLPNWSQSFNTSGGHSLYLITGNGTCNDTSGTRFFQVGNCNLSAVTRNWVVVNNTIEFDANNIPGISTQSPMNDINTEATTSISDADGNLLFFSDGASVWDRNYNLMPNGQGLLGRASASQCVLAVPHPGNPNQYYLFTNDDFEHNIENGLRYSILDMTLNNGLGDVITSSKNTLLLNGGSEKLNATWHANGHDIWVATNIHDTNRYYAFLLDNSGVHAEPVISEIGAALTTSLGIVATIGCMKFSHDGNRMAVVLVGNKILVCDFNKSTGRFSHPIELPLNRSGDNQPNGLEFSPDNSKLYVGQWQGNDLVQYDLSLTVSWQIAGSRLVIDPYNGASFGQLKLGPDGRIYVHALYKPGIDVIVNPNVAGVGCNYQQSALLTSLDDTPGSSMPNLLQGYFTAHTPVIAGPLNICKGGTTYTYGISMASQQDSAVWTHTGPGTLIAANGATQVTLTSATTEGVDLLTVTVFGRCGITRDTLSIRTNSPETTALPDQVNICDSVLVSPGEGFLSYEWSDGSNASMLNAQNTGEYWVNVRGASGCVISDTTDVITFPEITKPDLGADSTICNEQVVVLATSQPYAGYEWQDGSGNPQFTAFLPGTYRITVFDGCAYSSDTMNIVAVTNTTDINLNYKGNEVVCSSNLPFVLAGPVGYARYDWSDGSVEASILITENGTYSVAVTDVQGCILRDTLRVDDCLRLNPAPTNSVYSCYPNPTDALFHIRSHFSEKLLIRIFSASGQLILQDGVNANSVLSVNTGNYASGLYLIEVRSSGQIMHEKMVVEH